MDTRQEILSRFQLQSYSSCLIGVTKILFGYFFTLDTWITLFVTLLNFVAMCIILLLSPIVLPVVALVKYLIARHDGVPTDINQLKICYNCMNYDVSTNQCWLNEEEPIINHPAHTCVQIAYSPQTMVKR